MLRITGIKDRRGEFNPEWDPRCGLWTLAYERLSDELVSGYPTLVDRVESFAQRRPDNPLRLDWLGFPDGSSLGRVTHTMIRFLRADGCDIQFRNLPVHRLPPSAPIGPPHTPVDSPPELEQPSAAGEFDFEIQLSSWQPGTSPCVRFFFNEFAALDMSEGHEYVRDGDLVWVPSQYSAERLTPTFPRNQVIVVPHGVDTETFHEDVEPFVLPEGKFHFLYVGTTLSRKGYDLVLEAFSRVALPDAVLLLRISPTFYGFDTSAEADAIPGVRRIVGWLTDQELAGLYRAADVLLCPSRGEAFGLPVLEAMACGTMPIVTEGCAMDDFCPAEVRYGIPTHRVVSDERTRPGLDFLEPDLDALCGLMRRAYDQRAEVRERGRLAAQIARRYTWTAVSRMFHHELSRRCTNPVFSRVAR
jgi:Glycosyl transferases group 1